MADFIALKMRPLAMIVIIALLMTLATPKQINITVMVPGRKAFRNLHTIVQQMNSSLNDYDAAADYAYTGPRLGLNEFLSGCVNGNDINVECVHYTQDYVIHPWSYVFAKSALDLALKDIKRSEGLLDGFDIALRYYDSGDEQGKASVRLAQIAAVDSVVLDHMTALIGPMNPYAMARVSSLTSHWGKLNLTPGAISIKLKGKEAKSGTDKNTLIRTGPVASEVGDCVSAILRFYNWTSTAVEVFEDGGMERYHYFMMEGVFDRVKEAYPDLEQNQIRLSEYKNNQESLLRYNYPVAFMEVKKQGRVLIISADGDTVLEMLEQAIVYGHNGEYVYIIIDLEDQLGPTPWKYEDENGTEIVDVKLRKILETALVVTLPKEQTRKHHTFVHKLKEELGRNLFEDLDPKLSRHIAMQLADSERLQYGADSLDQYFQKNPYPAYLYDSLVMLAHVLNSSLHDNSTLPQPEGRVTTGSQEPSTAHNHINGFNNGGDLMNAYVANKTFQGVSGAMTFDEKGDRMFDFVVFHYDVDEDKFKKIGNFDSGKGHYFEHTDVDWPGGTPPPDVPKCGFDGSKCSKPGMSTLHSTLIAVAGIVVLLGIGIAIYAFRSYALQKELESQLWRVHRSDITWSVSPDSILSGTMNWSTEMERARASESDPTLGEMMSYFVPSMPPGIAAKRAHKRKRKWSSNSKKNDRVFDSERKTSAGSLISERAWGGLTTIGLYKDKTVVLKLTNRKKVELTREVLMELKHMRDVTHEHLTRFEGACLEWPHICILTEYCGKGSLKDILLNEEITMDWMFRVSLMNDLVKGMRFLHGSAIHCHGNLKSTNCVVDSRFVLKITDYGLKSFRNIPSDVESERDCEKKLWTAPELLRCSSNTFIGSQKGDVYSFGIILQEIALRKGPFYVGGIPLSCREIISKVRCGFPPYFRPMIDLSILSEDICNLMHKCWHEDPNERPDFTLTQKIIERFNRENPGNLVENLLHRMEQYAINLEGLVEERTAAYMEEKQKADDLLYQMLPVSVVDRLKRGDAVPAEAFESVTICFTDIVGFTSLSAASSPMQIVSLLNDLYTCFDAIIDNFDVYKVETIGDAYMLVSGLPVRNGIRHAREIARTALALLRAVSNFKIRHRPGDQLKLRIGIHTGPCCAGVVGLKMPRYCLFGDTVNTASRMESSGSPLAIHVSESTKQLLDKYQSFQLQLRGDVPMKGKGALTTYWLVGEVTDDVKSFPEKESRI